ncbi:hypothetical protein GEMRC1_002621 [Eukaryota sp. GEM-RC1]
MFFFWLFILVSSIKCLHISDDALPHPYHLNPNSIKIITVVIDASPPYNTFLQVQCDSPITLKTSLGMAPTVERYTESFTGSSLLIGFDACLYESGFPHLGGLFLSLESEAEADCKLTLSSVHAAVDLSSAKPISFFPSPNLVSYFSLQASNIQSLSIQGSNVSSLLLGAHCPLRPWTTLFSCETDELGCRISLTKLLLEGTPDKLWLAVTSSLAFGDHPPNVTLIIEASTYSDSSFPCVLVDLVRFAIWAIIVISMCCGSEKVEAYCSVAMPFVLFGLVVSGDFLSVVILLFFVFCKLIAVFTSSIETEIQMEEWCVVILMISIAASVLNILLNFVIGPGGLLSVFPLLGFVCYENTWLHVTVLVYEIVFLIAIKEDD